MAIKICIIKLGALGDVVRTTPLLLGIKEKYPESEITWITKSNAKEILEDNKLINKELLTKELFAVRCRSEGEVITAFDTNLKYSSGNFGQQSNKQRKTHT